MGETMPEREFVMSDETKNKLVEKTGGVKAVERALARSSEVRVISHIVNLEARPREPKDWVFKGHVGPLGNLPLVPFNLQLLHILWRKRYDTKTFADALKGKQLLNANVHDHYVEHPGIYPQSWHGKHVLFAGSEFTRVDRDICFRLLYHDGTEPHSRLWIGNPIPGELFVAVGPPPK